MMEKQHFILERTKLNDDDYDQNQVLVPMEMEKRYITKTMSPVNEIAAQTLSCLAACQSCPSMLRADSNPMVDESKFSFKPPKITLIQIRSFLNASSNIAQLGQREEKDSSGSTAPTVVVGEIQHELSKKRIGILPSSRGGLQAWGLDRCVVGTGIDCKIEFPATAGTAAAAGAAGTAATAATAATAVYGRYGGYGNKSWTTLWWRRCCWRWCECYSIGSIDAR